VAEVEVAAVVAHGPLAVCRRERVLPRNGELGGHYRAKRGATDMLLPSRMAKNEPDYPLSDRLLGQGSCGVGATGQGAVAHGAERGSVRVLRWQTREGHQEFSFHEGGVMWCSGRLRGPLARRRRRPCAVVVVACDNRGE